MAGTDESTPSSTDSLSTSSPFPGALASPFAEVCGLCGNRILGDYFRVNGLMACPQYAEQARTGQPRDSHVAYARGLLLGTGAAVLGMAFYATVTIVTGWSIGYVALGVGWLIAKAIKRGSNGLGGRRYQIAAVLLTYAAISIAAVPIGISYAIKHHKAEVKQAEAPRPSAGYNDPNATNPNAFPEPSAPPAPPAKPPVHWGQLAGQLVLMGLASPFLDLKAGVGGGLLGLFILFIGLRIAWRLTAAAALQVEGPFAPLGAVTT